MSETANVRLVRCPKCENLLPEVTDYSVYQCGGCGAVLRAKNKGVDLDTYSEKSNEGSIREKLPDTYEEKMNASEKRIMETSDGSESDVRSTVSSSSRAERRRRILRDGAENNQTNLMNKDEIWDVEANCSENDVRSNISSSSRAERRRILPNNRTNLANKDEKWDVEDDLVQDKRSNEFQRARNDRDFEDLPTYNENGLRGPRNGRRMHPGPSNPVTRPIHGYENAEYVGEDRAELLKQLDELTDKLNRSGNLIDKGKEKAPVNRRMAQSDPYGPESWYPDSGYQTDASSEMNRSVYENRRQYPEPPPHLMHRREMGGNGYYNPPRYADPMRSNGHRRGPYQNPSPYQISPSGSGYMDPIEPYHPNFNNSHHPSCPCYQCLNKRQVANDKMLNYHGYSSFGSRDYNNNNNNHGIPDHPRPLRSRTPSQPHTRWPSDVNSEMDGFALRRPATRVRHCRPIAGGAPFMTCHNCFELLMLPEKVLNRKNNKNRKKMKCGSCSTVIALAVSDKNLVVSDNYTPVKVDNPHVSQARTTFSSEDYDNSSYDFRSTEKAKTNSTEMKKSRLSTSTYNSEAEEDRESALSGPRKEKADPPLAGTSLGEYFEHSNKYHLAKRLGEAGNKSGRSENEKDKIAPRRKESSATEIDISSNEYLNTGTTIDSGEGSREGDNLKRSSILAGIRETGFKGSNRSEESLEREKANVTVNGHLISGRLIKKAEKFAGPIHPGNYWYDFRAGFWGAIGGPCLGIIPPFIEEFNYPMPDHCAGGNTHVYINGRELNQKDLNLLGCRGLPREAERSYIVEISGRVLDEDTGEELQSLGKLAPTVERVKHGFGMRAPNTVASK